MLHPSVLTEINQEHLKDLQRTAKRNRLAKVAQKDQAIHSIFRHIPTLNIELNFHLEISDNKAKAGIQIRHLVNDGT